MASLPATLTLTQTKLVAGSTFAVRSVCTGATPAALVAPLVIVAAGAVESFVRVATFAELQGGAFTANPLTVFSDAVGHPESVALPGDTLRIFAPPAIWDDSGPASLDYTVAAIEGGGRVVITGDTPFPTTHTSLSWAVLNAGGVTIASGNSGVTQRYADLPEFIDSQATVIFSSAVTATEHLESMQAYLDTLVTAFNSDPDTFHNSPPGNPVVTVYPRS